MYQNFKNITIVGSGTMGSGIAHTFAQHHYQVALFDISSTNLAHAKEMIEVNTDRQLTKGILDMQQKEDTLNRIAYLQDLKEAVTDADLVVEAASENINIKTDIFKQLDKWAKAETILASNTSSISITKIAAATERPDKVIGMHFMNPVPVMKLVEVIRGYATSDLVNQQIIGLSKTLDKIPVEVNDYPGFVTNRVLMPMINEAVYSLYEGVAGVAEIDTVMKLGMAHPMGPLQLADFIGLDICLSILDVLYKGFSNPKYAPCPLLVNMVAAGNKGIKSGEGFYKYTKGTKEIAVSGKFINRSLK